MKSLHVIFRKQPHKLINRRLVSQLSSQTILKKILNHCLSEYVHVYSSFPTLPCCTGTENCQPKNNLHNSHARGTG
uniref:Uncharacterized protein n=1 Tax=Daphnia magna TaxID=35525 RepID=A0A0P6BJG4_9CRUS